METQSHLPEKLATIILLFILFIGIIVSTLYVLQKPQSVQTEAQISGSEACHGDWNETEYFQCEKWCVLNFPENECMITEVDTIQCCPR